MEAVRKPKTKTRTRTSESTQPHATGREREAVQGGPRNALDRVLPDVPLEEPGSEHIGPRHAESYERDQSASPEPEEIQYPVEQTSDHAPASTRYIFPRTRERTEDADERFNATDTKDESATTEPLMYPVLETEEADEVEPSAPLESIVMDPNSNDFLVTPAYPNLNVPEAEKLELLTEECLAMYYHNALYAESEELVDNFCKEEKNPSGPLSDLLRRFKKACEDLERATVDGSSNSAALNDCLAKVWTMQPRIHKHTGTCDEYQQGSGTGKYEIAVMNAEKLEEITKLLTENRDITLKKVLCHEIKARSIALQIQWIILDLIMSFFAETGTSSNSLPILLADVNSNYQTSRSQLRAALSDLFSFMRTPKLPKRCTEAAIAWITELTSALHKSCLTSDGLWLLCHALRMPSPSAEWTAPLIQTFVQSNSPDKLKMDYCFAMVAQLMNPIKARESFLAPLNEKTDGTTESSEGEADHITISESDLTTLLEQLPIADFYSTAIEYFQTKASPIDNFLSLIAFQLLLMKILRAGLDTYSKMEYKAFCKQIGMALRKSVRELACHWKVTRALLNPSAILKLQLEMDRIMLLAVSYIMDNRSLGVWQYLIDLPYDTISPECRVRVEYILRKSVYDDCKSVRELFETTPQDVFKEMQTSTLAKRLETAGTQDTVFLVQTLAALVVNSSTDPTPFLREAVQVCFVDESTRESLYKVGRETIATILNASPSALDALISIIDRNIDHIEEHVMDIFASAPLHLCRIDENVVGGVLGKWLIGRAGETPGNRVARRVLSALNWGYDESGEELWLSESTHLMCAETVIKAHIAHTARTSGVIATLGRLVYSSEHDENFTQFCWQQLIRLKLPVQVDAGASTTAVSIEVINRALQYAEKSKQPAEADICAKFVFAAQHSLSSAENFASSGLSVVGELVSAGATTAAAVLLARAFALHYERASVITENENFLPVLEKLLHSDQSSYAYQLYAGAPSEPTRIVKLLSCAITYNARHVANPSLFLRVWIDALIVKRATSFNTDQVSLHLLGTIARLAFEVDPSGFLRIIDQLRTAHTLLSTWDESTQGYLYMVYGDASPPPLIPSSHLSISPWASFVCLCVEDEAFGAYIHTAVYNQFAQNENSTLEEALKEAATKSPYCLPMDRLPVFRWMEFCRVCGTSSSSADKNAPVLALALQRLALQLFTPRSVDGKKLQLAGKYVAMNKEKWQSFEDFLYSIPDGPLKILPKAVARWIRAASEISQPSFSDFSLFDLDHLLRGILAGEDNISSWLNFVDMNTITAQSDEDSKMYASLCHQKGRPLPSTIRKVDRYQRAPMRRHGSRALPFPTLPEHQSLPQPPKLDRSTVSEELVHQMVLDLLNNLSKLAEKFIRTVKSVEQSDIEYCEILKKLHVPTSENLDIVVTCSPNCQKPAVRTVKVNSTKLNKIADTAKNVNRKGRVSEISEVQQLVTNAAALHSASIEHIARQLCTISEQYVASVDGSHVQNIARSLFALFLSSTAPAHSFPPAIASLNQALKLLAKSFTIYQPEEFGGIVDLVMGGSPLSPGVIECFHPERLSSELFVETYRRLSEAVQKPELSQRATALLARFSIGRTSASPVHLRPLMPIVFINVTAASACKNKQVGAAMRKICMTHFVDFTFHNFPANTAYGLELALKGCNMGTTPAALLTEIVKQFEPESFDAHTCFDCIKVTTRVLEQAEASSCFSKWNKHAEASSRLNKLLVERSSAFDIAGDSSKNRKIQDLVEIFARLESHLSN